MIKHHSLHLAAPSYTPLPIHETNNPGWPIVSSSNCPAERISAFLDHYPHRIVYSLPSFDKDTYHFLQILNSITLPTDSKIITFIMLVDVTSLYTSVLHREGLSSLRYFPSNLPTPQIPSTELLIYLSSIILTYNSFYI
jgi:hypothetical protein